MNAAAETMNELFLRQVRELPVEVLLECFHLSPEMIKVLKSLDDSQLQKLIKTNQFLVTLKEDIL